MSLHKRESCHIASPTIDRSIVPGTCLLTAACGVIDATTFLAFAMGVQNALVLFHAVPDIATNLMTLTNVRLLASWSVVARLPPANRIRFMPWTQRSSEPPAVAGDR